LIAMSNIAKPQIKLEVKDLRVWFSHAGKVRADVRDVSFSLGPEKMAIVRESGTGKTTVGRSQMRLHKTTAR
ncbi:ABC transporter ATP-binding protein, partial [Pseudomonas syringae pv. tagetis]